MIASNFWQMRFLFLCRMNFTLEFYFFVVYKKPGVTPGRGQNIYNCAYDRPPKEGQVCDVQIRNLHPCSEENMFNFHKAAPCIFIKLNKV